MVTVKEVLESADTMKLAECALIIIEAFARGEANGGSTDWEEIGAAHLAAMSAIPCETVAAIESAVLSGEQ